MKLSGAGLFSSPRRSKKYTYTMSLFRMKPNESTNGSGRVKKKSVLPIVLSGQEAM